MPRVDISPRDSFHHLIRLKKGQKIEFNFCTLKKNIAFGIFFKRTTGQLVRQEDLFLGPEKLHISPIEPKRQRSDRKSVGSADDQSTKSNQDLRKSFSSKKRKDYDYIEVLPIKKYQSYKNTISGFIEAPMTGTFVFLFDNTFSIKKSKTLVYDLGSLSSEHLGQQGWLLRKRQRSLKGWEKNYFIFTQGTLKYCQTPDSPIIGEVFLATASITKLPERMTLIIDTGINLFKVRALNEVDYKKWSNILCVDLRTLSKLEISDHTDPLVDFKNELNSIKMLSNTLNDFILNHEELKTGPIPTICSELCFSTNNLLNMLKNPFIKTELRSPRAPSVISEDVFFDAPDVFEVHELEVSDSEILSESSESERVDSAEFFDTRTELDKFEGRLILPAKMQPMNFSIMSLMKKSIGKDLGSIAMPVISNEPLSVLQNLCEDLEYCNLLKQASESEDAVKRMLLVSCFAISAYARTAYRQRKPYNSLLGETFDYQTEDFKFVSEKVSHRPVIIACHADSPYFTFWQEMKPKSKFWGKSIEVHHSGSVHLILKSTNEHYVWNKVSSRMRNVLSGNGDVEHYGLMEVKKVGSTDQCSISFKAGGFFRDSTQHVEGVCKVQNHDTVTLKGSWNEILMADYSDASLVLWQANPVLASSAEYFGFSRFALQLNAIDDEIASTLPHTDSRLRPDQRMYENGLTDEAEREKQRLEQLQRDRRKEYEAINKSWTPNWFKLENDKEGNAMWIYNDKYWEAKKSKSFPTEIKLW